MEKQNNPEWPLIYQAMINILNDVAPISKEKKNQQQGFMYRGIDDMYNELHAVFAKHGVFPTSEVLEITREDRVTSKGTSMIYTVQKIKYTFWAADGSNVSSILTGEASDSGDKSSNKSMSIAFKYALMQSLLIPTEELKESDPDAESVASKPKPQAAKNNSTRGSKSGDDDAQTNNKPTLSQTHKNYKKIINQLAVKEVTIDVVQEHFNISDDLKKQMSKDTKARMKELKEEAANG